MMSREQLLKLDVNKIRSNGRYVDFETPALFVLTPEDIDFLRHYYKKKDIASDVIIQKERQRPKKYQLSKSEHYSNNKFRIKKRFSKKIFVPVIMFGSVILVSTGFIASKLSVKATPGIYESSGILYEDPSVEDIREELNELGVLVESDVDIPDTSQVLLLDSIDIVSNRIDKLMYFCNVYQVDFNMIYNRLKELTNDFTNKDYLDNHHIPNVTCKGEEVYAKNEEELLLYFVRCCKQLPNQMGLDNSIYVSKDYDSTGNYYDDMYYCSRLVGVDPCLVYGIIMSESGLDSEMFQRQNNPAGLRNGNGFWTFDTKTEGIFETCLEVLKYNRKGMNTIEEISSSYAPVGSKDDPNNLNALWVDNVTYNYQYAQEHFDTVFGIEKLRKE